MSEVTIKNLEELIQKSVGPTKRVVKSISKQLTAPGENYMGIVLKVEAVLENENGEEENFSAVGKCVNFKLPKSMRTSAPNQFKKENGFYTVIVPTLEEFQKEIGLEEKGITDVFPQLYASRSSLDENKEVSDDDSVLLFEYLGDKGYANTDRTVGFDLDGAKLILKDLTAFHAIAIALKLKKPKVFEDKVKPYLTIKFHDTKDKPVITPEQKKTMDEMWFKILEPFNEVKPYLERLRAKLAKSEGEMMESFKREPKEPFATISHADLWTNNTMQMFDDGKPIKNKILDFQTFQYFSAMQDLIFFLWSSVQLPTLQKHYDDLIKFYYDHFINLLDKCGCDTTPFNYENFLKEIDENAEIEFFHILFMQMPIYGKKGEAVIEMEKIDKIDKMNEEFARMDEKFTETAKKRTAFIVSTFGKRGWF